jgi:hypothetical protein
MFKWNNTNENVSFILFLAEIHSNDNRNKGRRRDVREKLEL